jgi:DNA invertase Pin-like site-specific DNA recombinase
VLVDAPECDSTHALGMRVITANGDDLTETGYHTKVAMRQIAGAFSQLEKAHLVAELKAALDRKREANGKCEGRKSYPEARPGTVALAKELEAHGLSYSIISAELAARGRVTRTGKPHVPSAVQKILGQ